MPDPYITDAAVMAAVKERYASAARRSLSLVPVGGACCGPSASDPISADLYAQDEVPSQGALTASLGCGNPTALITLEPGQDVLALGSGGALDVMLSARRVAPGGLACGVDMTDEMLELANRNKAGAGVTNATFLK